MTPLPPQNTYAEVITGISPLERELVGQHPRLHLTAPKVEELRRQLQSEPYASMLAAVRSNADRALASGCPAADAPGDRRGSGDTVANLAFAYLMTREAKYLQGARDHMLTIAAYPEASWHAGLLGGHLLYGQAVAYDWLYHDLDAATRDTVFQSLKKYGEHWFMEFATHASWAVNAYTCNHVAVHIGGLTAAAAAIYGEPPEAPMEKSRNGPWLKVVLERLRVLAAALGPDGASQEGITYGEYYAEFFIRALDIAHGCLGEDFFTSCDWVRHLGLFQIYSSVPVKRWNSRSCLLNFGDGVRHHWYGPTGMLRRTARAYRDPHIQWFVQATQRDGITVPNFLDMIWHDPSVNVEAPAKLPTSRHFDDKDLVVLRSGWDGDESVFAFHCGPHSGHHALQNYSHDVGGGHMHPDAGTFQLLVRGDRLIADDSYTFKRTEYQNTLLINGIGQAGDGREWFEGIELRRTKRGPRISFVQNAERFDHLIGDVTAAYDPATGLKKFLRHVLYLKPACWIIVDELQAQTPSTFELYFHGDYVFEPVPSSSGVFQAKGPNGSLRMTVLHPSSLAVRAFKQPYLYVTGSVNDHREALTIGNVTPSTGEVFVTVLEAGASSAAWGEKPSLSMAGRDMVVTLRTQGAPRRVRLTPGRAEPTMPVVEILE